MKNGISNKIIVNGAVKGNFIVFFKKIEQINKLHGPFSFLICVGNFFGKDSTKLKPFIDGTLKIPLKTYFIVDGKEEDLSLVQNYKDGGEIVSNLTFLGNYGVKTIENVKISYLSGRLENDNQQFQISNDSLSFLAASNDVDLLLTCEWPQKISSLERLTSNSKKNDLNNIKKPQTPFERVEIASLNEKLSPRYHFAADGKHFQPPAFLNGLKKKLVRFVALNSFENEYGEKSTYAFNLNLGKRERIEGAHVLSPFSSDRPMRLLISEIDANKKSKLARMNSSPKPEKLPPNIRWITNPPDGYICDNCDNPGHWSDNCDQPNIPNDGYICKICKVPGHFVQDCKETKKSTLSFKRRGERNQCWFCSDTKIFEKHLVILRYEKAYLSLAKGGVNDKHCIIVPKEHIERSLDSVEPLKNIYSFKKILKETVKGSAFNWIFFERALPSLNKAHAFIDCFLIPNEIEKKLLKRFVDEISVMGFDIKSFEPKTIITKNLVNHNSYLLLESSDSSKLLVIIPPGKRFRLIFFRELICSTMGIPSSFHNWRNCVKPHGKEIELVNSLQKEFNNIITHNK